MARDRQAEAARRDAKARAAGFTSYGQQYRARKAGYTGDGKGWNNTLDTRRLGGVQRRSGGHLEGYGITRAGTVLSARIEDNAAMRHLQAAVNRFGDRRRAQVVFDPDDGKVRNFARFGGVKVADLKVPPDEEPTRIAQYVEAGESDFYEGGTELSGIVTVTIA